MRRYALPFFFVTALAVVLSQRQPLLAQMSGQNLPPAPAAGAPSPTTDPNFAAPRTPAVPPGGWAENPLLPPASAPPMAPVPPMVSMPGMPGWPSGSPSAFYGTAAPRPPDPKVMELTLRYNELEQKVMFAAQEFRRADQDGEQREKLQQQITEITAEQFQLRHQVRQMEVERLQKQLAQLQEQLQRRDEQKKEIIDRRVAQLTDQADELRWEPLTPPGAHTYGAFTETWTPTAPAYGVPAPAPAPYGAGAYRPAVPFDPMVTQPAARLPRQAPRDPASAAAPSREPHTPATPSVAETETRLAIAERELARIKPLVERGTVSSYEMDKADDALRLAKIALDQARQDQELAITMMQLDVRREQAELEALQTELRDLQQQAEEHKDDRDIAAQMRRAAGAVQRKEVELQRAEAMLERQRHRAQPEEPPAEKSAR